MGSDGVGSDAGMLRRFRGAERLDRHFELFLERIAEYSNVVCWGLSLRHGHGEANPATDFRSRRLVPFVGAILAPRSCLARRSLDGRQAESG